MGVYGRPRMWVMCEKYFERVSEEPQPGVGEIAGLYLSQ